MMNNNYHEYGSGMELLLLSCSKPFQFCSKDTHIKFLLIKPNLLLFAFSK